MFSISLTRAMSIHLICNSICLDIWDPLETSQKFYGNPVGSLWNHAEIEWESLEILRKSYGARRKSDANPMEILRKSYGIPWKYETKWDPANPNESTWISVRHGPGPGPAKPRDAGGSCKVHVSWMDIFSHTGSCIVDPRSLSWMQGSRMQDSGAWVQDTGPWVSIRGSVETGSWIQDLRNYGGGSLWR